jgi:hypothetical protein
MSFLPHSPRRSQSRYGTELLLAALLALSLPFSSGLAGATARAEGALIQGRVLAADGAAVAGIQLRWAAGGPDAPSAVTGDDGKFFLQATQTGETTILLEGDRGVGAVRISKGELDQGELRLIYPVRTEIVLLHDNDLHWHYNHAGELRQVIGFMRESRPNVFLLNAGDTFVRHRHRWAEDSFEYYEQMCAFIIDEMNKTGYDVKALGNHEVDYKADITLRQLQRAKFPILGANVRSSTRHYFTPPSHVYFNTDNGLRIAVMGMTVGSAPDVEVADRPATVREHLHLRRESDLFVLLTHIGLGADRQLAEQFSEIDVIVGATGKAQRQGPATL